VHELEQTVNKNCHVKPCALVQGSLLLGKQKIDSHTGWCQDNSWTKKFRKRTHKKRM